jgi:hypothetical protein
MIGLIDLDVHDPGKGGGLGNRGDEDPNATGGGVDGWDVDRNPGCDTMVGWDLGGPDARSLSGIFLLGRPCCKSLI